MIERSKLGCLFSSGGPTFEKARNFLYIYNHRRDSYPPIKGGWSRRVTWEKVPWPFRNRRTNACFGFDTCVFSSRSESADEGFINVNESVSLSLSLPPHDLSLHTYERCRRQTWRGNVSKFSPLLLNNLTKLIFPWSQRSPILTTSKRSHVSGDLRNIG